MPLKNSTLVGSTAEALADEGSKQFTETMAGLREGVSAAGAGIETVQARVQDGAAQGMKSAERFMAFGRGNLEAMTQAGQIWVSGLQDLGRQVAATMQASFDESMGAARRLGGVRSVREAVELQTGLARSGLDTALNEATRLTESSIKLVERAMAPLAARATEAMEQITRA